MPCTSIQRVTYIHLALSLHLLLPKRNGFRCPWRPCPPSSWDYHTHSAGRPTVQITEPTEPCSVSQPLVQTIHLVTEKMRLTPETYDPYALKGGM